MKVVCLFLCVLLGGNATLIPYEHAWAQSTPIIDGIVNEPSNLPSDQLGYEEFRNETVGLEYTGGSVCISSQADTCSPLQIDDGIKVFVGGEEVINEQSRTQDVGPFYLTSKLHPDSSYQIRVVLFDMQGPYRGTSPIYLVVLNQSSQPCVPFVIDKDIEWNTPGIQIKPVKVNAEVSLGINLSQCEHFNIVLPDDNGYAFEISDDNSALRLHTNGLIEIIGWPFEGEKNQPIAGANVVSEDEVMAFAGVHHNIHSLPDSFNQYGIEGSLGGELKGVFRTKIIKASNNPDLNLAITTATFTVVVIGIVYTPVDEVSVIAASAYTALVNALQNLVAMYPLAPVSQTPFSSVTASVISIQSLNDAPDDVRQALVSAYGPLAEAANISTLTSSKNPISAYTEFTVTGEGFLPNSVVLVTFGLPDSVESIIEQAITADAAGSIIATITMPEPSQVPLGEYVVTAIDISHLDASLQDFFANPENTTITPYMAAMLINVVEDVTPPETVAYATGPLDTNGIFRNDVTIHFEATDDLSGVDHSEYSLDNGVTWTSLANGGSFTISGNGIMSFKFRSFDRYGNVEDVKDSGPIIINKYIVFASDTDQSLSLQRNTGTSITGEMHTNGSYIISYNTGVTLQGALSAAGSGHVVSGNTNTTIPTQAGALVTPLSYPLSHYAQHADVVYDGDLELNDVNREISGIHYINGNLTLRTVKLTGDVTFVATGNIIDQSTSTSIATTDPNNGIVLFAGGDISVSSTGASVVGLYYAPNGAVHIDGATGLTLNGSLVGSKVSIDRTTNNTTIRYDAAIDPGVYQLPLVGLGIPSDAPPTPVPTATQQPTQTPTPTLTPTPQPTQTPVPTTTSTPISGSGSVLYVSADSWGEVSGAAFEDNDILNHDRQTGGWSIELDGSVFDEYVGAFHRMADGSWLLSFESRVDLPGIGRVEDEDVVRYYPATNSYEPYFDGSAHGFTDEIDAIAMTSAGELVLSSTSSFTAGGLNIRDEDLFRVQNGSLTFYFDASDIGVTGDIVGAHIDENGVIYFATSTSYYLGNVRVDDSDITRCVPSSLGDITACSLELWWDGQSVGFNEEIDGISIEGTSTQAAHSQNAVKFVVEEQNLYLPSVQR